jgi:REP element-mobilizing transposase RayT
MHADLAMPKAPRGYISSGVYHVTTRTAGPIRMFVDDVDRTQYCSILERTLRRQLWTCWAFCLMPTHFHLLLDVPEESLQPGMQSLNWAYARYFNSRHGRKGHLVGDRYGSRPVLSDGHALSALRYIARNPVKAGLCAHPAEWSWSSYRGCARFDKGYAFVDSSALRAYFGVEEPLATQLLRAFVEE